jgi:hypothetical protein
LNRLRMDHFIVHNPVPMKESQTGLLKSFFRATGTKLDPNTHLQKFERVQ